MRDGYGFWIAARARRVLGVSALLALVCALASDAYLALPERAGRPVSRQLVRGGDVTRAPVVVRFPYSPTNAAKWCGFDIGTPCFSYPVVIDGNTVTVVVGDMAMAN